MGNVLPLRSIPTVNLDPKKTIDVNSARLQSAIICETNNGQNYIDQIERSETTEAWLDFATACKKIAQALKLSSGGAKIGEQIYMTQRMMELKSEFTDKAQEFKEQGADLMEFGKETGLQIGNVFKVAEEFYKTANAVQLSATQVRGNAHTVAQEKQGIATDAYAKFDKAIALRDRANDMKLGAKFELDMAYKTPWPNGVGKENISVAKTNYTNANKYYGEKNQQALQAQGVAQSAKAQYLSAVDAENDAIGTLNSANEQLHTSAENYIDAKAEVDKYNAEVNEKLIKFNKTKEELQGVMHEVKNEQVSSNKRLALYAVGGKAGAVSQAIGEGIDHIVAGENFRGIAKIGVGGLAPFTETLLAGSSPYVPLVTGAVDAVAVTSDTGDYKTAFWNFGDSVLGLNLMMQNVKDINDFYDALEDDDYVTAFSLSGRSITQSWNVGCRNVGTAVAMATGVAYADKVIGVSGKIASDIFVTPYTLGLTIQEMDAKNVSPDVMAGVAGLTLLNCVVNVFTGAVSAIDGGQLKAIADKAFEDGVAGALEGSNLAMENGVTIIARDYFGLNSFVFFANPPKKVEAPFISFDGMGGGFGNMALGSISSGQRTGLMQYDWWLGMGYDACGGELKPCREDFWPDINKSIQDTLAHNAFMFDCSKKQNAWLTPFDITDEDGAGRCGFVYGLTGMWVMNGCNTANTPIKSLVKLKDHLRPMNFSDINVRNGDQVDNVYGGSSVTPNP